MKDDKASKYFWMHLVGSDYRKNVVFAKTKFSNWPKLQLKNYQDYIRFDKEEDEFGLLRADFVTLDNKFDKTLDLFMISAFDQNLYASQKLIDALKHNNITGLNIVDATKSLVFDTNF